MLVGSTLIELWVSEVELRTIGAQGTLRTKSLILFNTRQGQKSAQQLD